MLSTKQEIFDKVAVHLLSQKQKSMALRDNNPALRCAYRGDEGLKCAAGCLIPDDKYSVGLEGMSVVGLDGCISIDWPFCFVQSYPLVDFTNRLQRIHDGSEPRDWKNHLYKLANDHGLNTEVLEAEY